MRVFNDGGFFLLVNDMDSVGGPDVVFGVVAVEDQVSDEETGDAGDISVDEEGLGGGAEVVVEPILANVDTEEDGGENEDDVVVDELFGDCVVEGGGAGGGGVELVEGMNNELGGRQEEIDSDEREDPADYSESAKECYPLLLTSLAEPDEGSEEVVGLELGDDSVSANVESIHAKGSENTADDKTNAEHDSDEDDDDHDVISSYVGGDWEEGHDGEREKCCHDGDGVEDTGKKVDDLL